ncbi:H(+)/Cl(-) exchange transporter ClcA [Methylocystis sp. WRRC1]|uniref:H(+)/Cl(-) exchange transporter ClcA n=1 Tax=Methylocystis sp. WRRC1 TaxID=1732014 RepID=UPI001D1504EE|nr:H(+)/Cl(-) exchange transporter ClcA [Methylocystis sp. WRRC1]MCC3243868.1 H(+)/Cl(-) exchange transporter ClcA [Methylocystis sp. WRRC1]
MRTNPNHESAPIENEGGLLVLALLSLVAGAAAGLVGAAFRLALEWAERLRDALIIVAHRDNAYGFIFFVTLCGVATFLAAWMVRRFSLHASGSGIPHVEAVLHGLVPPAPFRLLAVKFLGGALAIGAGLALGREGPSVQMGAVIGHWFGWAWRRSWPDCRVLIAAGAGAGLATAFNAPIAGAAFVLEELVQKFEHRIAIAALASSATAIAVARMILGDTPDFDVGALHYPSAAQQPLFFILGGVAGLFAIVYNRALLATIAAAEGLKFAPVELRAGVIGAGVGALAWFAPAMVGGGDGITQRALMGAEIFSAAPMILLLRFALGHVSYSAGAPGGLFAPLLALGALFGWFFGAICQYLFPGADIQPQAFALVGMTALFTGVVRAPLTGIVLVTEMTANTIMLLPMLGACFAAMLAPTLLRDAPIYESLRTGTLRRERALQQNTKT